MRKTTTINEENFNDKVRLTRTPSKRDMAVAIKKRAQSERRISKLTEDIVSSRPVSARHLRREEETTNEDIPQKPKKIQIMTTFDSRSDFWPETDSSSTVENKRQKASKKNYKIDSSK